MLVFGLSKLALDPVARIKKNPDHIILLQTLVINGINLISQAKKRRCRKVVDTPQDTLSANTPHTPGSVLCWLDCAFPPQAQTMYFSRIHLRIYPFYSPSTDIARSHLARTHQVAEGGEEKLKKQCLKVVSSRINLVEY